jgi:hypothetical protein
MKHYCVIVDDERSRIVGPFVSLASLSAFGRKWQVEAGDNPNWQSVELPDTHWWALNAMTPQASEKLY